MELLGPSRVAQVSLGNGLICTWMNNAVANSAVQPGVSNPGWTSGDFLGYDGAGRMIAKRFLSPHGSALVVGFSSGYDRAGNKFFERALHAGEPQPSLRAVDPVSTCPWAATIRWTACSSTSGERFLVPGEAVAMAAGSSSPADDHRTQHGHTKDLPVGRPG